MKHLILFSLIFISFFSVTLAKGTAEITFKETTHDFGSFPEDSTNLSYSFEFTNTGDGPLIIHQAIATCGCTIPKYPKEPIKPGESGIITVFYNSYGRPGHFYKSVTIRTNAKNDVTRLHIKGDMIPNEKSDKK